MTRWAKAFTPDVSRRSLIERLANARASDFSGMLFRSASPGYPPLSGEGARQRGGRWNPPDSFPVLYAATDPSAAAAEIARTALKYGVPSSALLPRHMYTIELRSRRVLDLTSASTRETVGFSAAVYTDDDIGLCQAIGDAAHYLGFEAILAPSAVTPAKTMAIFIGSLSSSSSIEVVGSELLDGDAVT